ncbi:MAG: P-loop NTPase fold protein, partial [Smithella sp.]
MSKIIKNSEPNKVFTIGLFGNWGAGKSSIIKTSQHEIEDQKLKFITYDAWQYINDSFRRMFLRKLREELKYEETDLMKKFYENESTDIGNHYCPGIWSNRSPVNRSVNRHQAANLSIPL